MTTPQTQDTQRMNIQLRRELHRQLKIEAAKQSMTMQEVFEQAIVDWLRRQQSQGSA